MQEQNIIKYIKGEADTAERKLVIEWIRKDIKNQKRYNILKANYVASNLDSLNVSDMDLRHTRFMAKRTKKRKRYLAAVVASVLLPIIVWQLTVPKDAVSPNTVDLYGQDEINVATGHGNHKKVVLPDGSTITLNAESSLTYPEKFSDSIRQVTLIGEAFFDIKKDISKPFIVNTEDITIKVLGTSFNVKSYPEDKRTETTLVTGKVEIFQQKIEKPIILTPSQRAVFDKEKNSVKLDKVDSEDIIAWREGKLVFDQTPLKQVVSDLNRKYDVEFVIRSDTLLQYKYTGEFNNLSLEEVLELLKISSPIDYKLVNNKIMLDME